MHVLIISCAQSLVSRKLLGTPLLTDTNVSFTYHWLFCCNRVIYIMCTIAVKEVFYVVSWSECGEDLSPPYALRLRIFRELYFLSSHCALWCSRNGQQSNPQVFEQKYRALHCSHARTKRAILLIQRC